ncbi:MAG: Gfo/Idh/MocA family protein, partial [Caldicoprobacterales bacterium]
MGKIKVAVIGCGTIANSAHIPSYLANGQVEIKYFCDIIPERAQAAVEKYGCGIAVQDYRDILDDEEVTAVSVCTPNNVHADISIDFMRAGKHVLCEKPAARTYEEALKMQKVQHETGKILNIGVVNRFNDGVNKIKNIIDSGELGEIYHVYASFRAHRSIPGLGGAFTTKEIAGGGALIDWGVHFLDIVMYCCQDPKPLTVTGEAFSKLGRDMKNYVYTDMWAGPPQYDGTYDVEDSITGLIRTEGPVITVNGAWAQNIGENEMFIDFMGTKGGIRLMYGADFKLYTTKGGALFE